MLLALVDIAALVFPVHFIAYDVLEVFVRHDVVLSHDIGGISDNFFRDSYLAGNLDGEGAARVAYLEAGSREKGIQAVLTVIYNRCMAASFGGEETTIEEEVYRKGQFSVIHHRRFDKIQPPEEYVEIARQVFYYGESYLPENVLFFCARRLGKGWGGRKFYKEIGGNLFFYGRVE